MKKKVRTPWIEFFKTGRFYKYIEDLDDELKKKQEKPKKVFWELQVTLINGNLSTLSTTNPDSDESDGFHAFDLFLEWYQCSTNSSYCFRFDTGLKIFIRDQIAEIQIIKKEK